MPPHLSLLLGKSPHARATSQRLPYHRLAAGNTVRGRSPSLYAPKTCSHSGFCPCAADHHRGQDTLLLRTPHPGVRKVIASHKANALLNPAVLNCSALNQHLSALQMGRCLPAPVSQPDVSLTCCQIFLEASFPAWLEQPCFQTDT